MPPPSPSHMDWTRSSSGSPPIPGQPLRPLAKVASGGELSRLSLAVQVACLAGAVRSMVFDEVDAGIGGAVAEIVGKELRALGSRGQVFCVTHLPQVASQGHHHLRVVKLTDGKTTRTSLVDLAGEERVRELARMLGGIQVSDKALAHAREMLAAPATSTSDTARISARRQRPPDQGFSTLPGGRDACWGNPPCGSGRR